MVQKGQHLLIEDARLIFRNFEGRQDKFNISGARMFCVLLGDDQADRLTRDGWNIKWLEPRDEGDTRQAYMNVSVSYKYKAPEIYVISSQTHRKTKLAKDEIHILDWAEIEKADMIIDPSHWQVGDASGVKAYLRKIYVTIIEDELDLKYADINPSDGDDFDD